MNHLISDMCNRIMTSSKNNTKFVIIKNSNIVLKSLFILYRLGFIQLFKYLNFKFVLVNLKYFLNRSVIRALFALSKPSKIFFIKYKSIQNFPYINSFFLNGFLIISANKHGLILDFEAVLLKKGGIALFGVC